MALFQEAIIKKHLLTLDEQTIENAFLEYKRVYSPDKIKNIRVAKEEQYQEGFIKEIFGSVLGYSVYPESPFNIETEKKNETNSKKADGAILKDEKVVGVIELKDNKTKNLDAVKDQAFGYKNNHKDCSYVISSNFHKLRFYIDDATDYEEFDLYNLDKETFKRFYLYLRKEGLLDKNLPKLLRQETKFHEEEISKKLYKDYSHFKRRFFENAVQNNPQHDKLELFKKSQKFLDRILFLLFAEDKGLVGTNSIVSIVEKWSGADDDYYQPLYEMVNKYFGHLYRGYTYQKTGEVIPQFGGELFAPDELLESLKIDDEVLKNDLLILSKYDFNTDVDVNILGHIFEHSLNEVDDVEAELRGETLDKTKSKRKKDGVFYTPKYITKYIVDNTLGKLCTEKKIELKLDEDIAIFEYQKADGKLNEKGKELFERLNTYKSWLLTLKVCDPACGSGAFLNQALSYFIEEHKFVDDIIAELTNTPLRLFDTDLQILENNIFGVDINEESVEIAKLSMWLRTAQPGRKLSDLSNNIKCGNSLIDDPAIAGDKAFNWEKEFPTVFEKGGFDVVIGNPPYVRVQGLKEHYFEQTKYYEAVFVSATGNYDIYVLFMEKCHNLINSNGIVSFILPHKFLVSEFGTGIRKFFKNMGSLSQIIHFGSELVFQDASTYTCICSIQKRKTDTLLYASISPSQLLNSFDFQKINFEQLQDDKWELSRFKNERIFKKISGLNDNLRNYVNVFSGIQTSADDTYILQGSIDGSFLKTSSGFIELAILRPIIKGNNIKKYNTLESNSYVIFPYRIVGTNVEFIEETEFSRLFPNCYKYLKENESKLRGRENGKMNHNRWYAYVYPKNLVLSNSSKLVSPDITLGLNIASDDGSFCLKNGAYGIEVRREELFYTLYAVLNSNLLWFYLSSSGNVLRGNYFRFNSKYIEPFYFHESFDSEDYFKGKIELISEYNSTFKKLASKFLSLAQLEFGITELSNNLKKWYTLTFPEFIKELKKKKIELTIVQKAEWLDYFETERNEIVSIKSQIDQTQNEIDRMIYELYGLTEEEIQIVENS